MSWVIDWTAHAACRSADPDELFVQGAAQNRAKVICSGCPVRTECLADALDSRVEFGVWGGMTERERRALLRRRPTVTSWRRLLETAKTEYEAAYGARLATAQPAGPPHTAPATHGTPSPHGAPSAHAAPSTRPRPSTRADRPAPPGSPRERAATAVHAA